MCTCVWDVCVCGVYIACEYVGMCVYMCVYGCGVYMCVVYMSVSAVCMCI